MRIVVRFVHPLIFLILSLVLSGCADDKESAQVESAPAIGDIKNIVIEGKAYTAREFVDAFCGFPAASEDKNCLLALQQSKKDMTKPVKVNW